jgi:hypothetical protein
VVVRGGSRKIKIKIKVKIRTIALAPRSGGLFPAK